jgi:D-alanyl-D-alanine-carboxypeptidase/D-alanyl-D-alanine-endopeptidase
MSARCAKPFGPELRGVLIVKAESNLKRAGYDNISFMKKYLILAFLVTTADTVFGQTPTDSIKAIIQREVAHKRSKSIIVGIIDADGRIIVSEGILSDENPAQPDSNTLYEIGSITKPFTSLLLADMSLKHQLNLNDPVSKFLPEGMKAPTRNGKEISLLTLSTHRSGMPRFPYNVDPQNLDNPYADYTVNQLYEYVSGFEPDVDIDTKWRYSNVGYGLLGNILSTVAQKDFEILVKQNICEPLHMSSTVISLTADLKSNTALGHTESGRPASFTDLGAIEGAGGLRSNVNDLLTFAAANLGLIQTDLYPAMELCHLPQIRKDGIDSYYTTMGWTFWDENGRQVVFKDGGTAGYRTFLGIDKKHKFGVVVLSNAGNSVTDIGLHILDSTYKIQPYRYQWNLLDTLRETIKTNGVAAGIELYQLLKASNNPALIFNESQLSFLGNELRRDGKIKDAIRIYELNAGEYPKSPFVYENLGETYKRYRDKKTAIIYFEKALELDPQNRHCAYILEKLKSN